MDTLTQRSYAYVSLDNIRYNYRKIRKSLKKETKFLGVVKANAYGHGALKVAQLLQDEGADYLAVACIDEAIELRKHNISLPILILGYTPANYTSKLIRYDLTQCVPNLDVAKEYSKIASKLNKTLKCHLKIDTGMSRLGFICAKDKFNYAINEMIQTCNLKNLYFEGIFTHFAVADENDENSKQYTLDQFNLFEKVIKELKKNKVTFSIRHCANTGATLTYKKMQLDMVRPGLLLYGYGDQENKLKLKPCMSLYSRINTIKYLDKGSDVSYGRHFTTKQKTKVATIGLGYADGLFRSLSNKCSFYCKGKFIKQIGNICMDQCMLNVTKCNDINVEDEVEIFGEHNSLIKLAKAANTIPYELLCAVSLRVKRIYK